MYLTWLDPCPCPHVLIVVPKTMDPASSSDDDWSSSSSSGEEDVNQKGRGGPKPAGSDDDNSSDDEDYGARNLSNFDDLPTDDSEDESDSDRDDSAAENQRVAGGSDDEGTSDDEDIDPEDLPLSERVAFRSQAGRRYYTGEDEDSMNQQDGSAFDDDGKKRRAERKSRAIELASVRLREARKDKCVKKKQTSKDDTSEDDFVEHSSNKNDDSKEETKRKKSKHAPTEMSSKRRDYFARGRPDLNSAGIGVSIGANKYKARDPRMVSLSGHLDADVFEKRYGFLNEVQDKEIEQLKRRVNAWRKPGKKGQKERKKMGMTQGGGSLEDDQEELTRLLQERAERNKAKVVRGAKRAVKQKIREDVASGKRGAYYPKRNELKRMEAEAKYEEIRKRGGDEAVDKATAKRRKKNLAKASKQMPSHMVS